ncbi:hypothetical protein RB195_018035 [Necator americanus]
MSRGGTLSVQLAVDDIMQRTFKQCPADVILAPSARPFLVNLEYADDVVIFALNSAKLQHVVNYVSSLSAAYALRLCPYKCKKMWISSRPSTGIRVDGQPIDEFCYLSCALKKKATRAIFSRDGLRPFPHPTP